MLKTEAARSKTKKNVTNSKTFYKTYISDKMLYLDATELLENPGMSLRRVANFAGVPPLINENNFFFDEEKGTFVIKLSSLRN